MAPAHPRYASVKRGRERRRREGEREVRCRPFPRVILYRSFRYVFVIHAVPWEETPVRAFSLSPFLSPPSRVSAAAGDTSNVGRTLCFFSSGDNNTVTGVSSDGAAWILDNKRVAKKSAENHAWKWAAPASVPFVGRTLTHSTFV